MKRIFKWLMFPTLIITSMQFSSCNALHIHDLKWNCDEENHWQECSICKEKIGVTPHSMNSLNDTCFVCNYHDPVFKTNGSATLTGLTKYGKTKNQISLNDDILLIGDYAFSESNCTRVTISDNLIGISTDAFKDSKVEEIVDPSEESVEWVYFDGIYYREDKIVTNECLVKTPSGTKYQHTFKEAVDSIIENDSTIVLLRDEIEINEPIDINYTITLEPLYASGCIIKDNGNKFYIHPSGYLKLANNIGYVAPTDLILTQTTEESQTHIKTDCYDSGSLIFGGLDEAPAGLNVEYVDSVERKSKGTAVGSVQSITKTFSEEKYFAYGIFKMNLDLNAINGLTDFGETVTNLHICNPILNKEFEIEKWAFIIVGSIKVPLPVIKDPTITLWKQKGAYTKVEIGKGITKINQEAFSTHIDSHIEKEHVVQVAHILSPMSTLKISNDVTEICPGAFSECVNLNSVYIGENFESKLTKIDTHAFEKCYLLKNVNLLNCRQLTEINKEAFISCFELHSATLPSTIGWTIGDKHAYLPSDMTPENVSMFLKSTYVKDKWVRNPSATLTKFAYCFNSEKDELGRFNQVHFSDDWNTVLTTADNQDSTIYIFDKPSDPFALWSSDKKIQHNLSIIADSSLTNMTISTTHVVSEKYFTISKNIKTESGHSIFLGFDGINRYDFSKVGGFGMEYEETPANASVQYYKPDGEGEIRETANASYIKIGDKKYKAYGILNFINDASSDTCSVLSLSNFGLLADEIILNTPIDINARPTYKTIIFKYTFKGNNKISKVEINEKIKEIGEQSFAECKQLKEVKISSTVESLGNNSFNGCSSLKTFSLVNDANLKNIGTNSFVGCNSLNYFDFANNTNGWTSSSTQIDPSELATPSKAAKLLRETYTGQWTRAI